MEKGYSGQQEQSFFISEIAGLTPVAKVILDSLGSRNFICISGVLGSGKTTLAQVLCFNMGIEKQVKSPTFNIVNSYWSAPRNCFVNHFDFFRIVSSDDTELFSEMQNNNINIIEWPEKAPFLIQEQKRVEVRITFEKLGRRIRIVWVS